MIRHRLYSTAAAALRNTLMLTCAALLCTASAHAAIVERSVVLELFTSQGCNSCPPADALLTKLADDPGLIALSFHVDYWDYIGWKDAFSLKDSTKRQYQYAAQFGKKSVFTPQLVIDGTTSIIGSRAEEVHAAIRDAQSHLLTVPLTITSDKSTGKLAVHLGTLASAPIPATVLAIRFQRHSMTEVRAGENKGNALPSANSVTEIIPLGTWSNHAIDFQLPTNADANHGVAVIVQHADGRILAAQTYIGL